MSIVHSFHRRRAMQALAFGTALATGTMAYATQLVYFNPNGAGHFSWEGGGPQSPIWLDITKPAANQPGTAGGPSSIAQGSYPPAGVSSLGGNTLFLDMVVVDVSGMGDLHLPPVTVTVAPLEGFVPSGTELWAPSAYIYSQDYGSLLPEGVETYIGVRFDPGDGFHYGWVGITRQGLDLDAWAWGYDTEPIPEPSTLAILVLGVGAARKRWLWTVSKKLDPATGI